MELLKQRNGAPFPVEEQVVSLYAGTQGFIDDLDVVDIRRFETELLESVRARNADLLAGVRSDAASRRGRRAPRAFTAVRPSTRRRRRRLSERGGAQERVLKRRIKSIESTKKITRAMELIAASRSLKAQQRVAAARPVRELLTQAIQNLAAAGGSAWAIPCWASPSRSTRLRSWSSPPTVGWPAATTPTSSAPPSGPAGRAGGRA